MKFKILVKNTADADDSAWWEHYEENTDNAQQWVEEVLQTFNDTLRPHEQHRTLLKVEVEGDSNDPFHTWEKSSVGMSSNFRGDIVDIFKCSKCGITGKRKNLSSVIKIDSKFRKKCFQDCGQAKQEIAKYPEKYS